MMLLDATPTACWLAYSSLDSSSERSWRVRVEKAQRFAKLLGDAVLVHQSPSYRTIQDRQAIDRASPCLNVQKGNSRRSQLASNKSCMVSVQLLQAMQAYDRQTATASAADSTNFAKWFFVVYC